MVGARAPTLLMLVSVVSLGVVQCLPAPRPFVTAHRHANFSGSTNECNPGSGKACNVCQNCCKDYIPAGADCDKCVAEECTPVPPPPPPSGQPCVGNSTSLKPTQCEAWVDFYDSTGGKDWEFCSDNRLDPCSCTNQKQPAVVHCNGGDITEV